MNIEQQVLRNRENLNRLPSVNRYQYVWQPETLSYEYVLREVVVPN